MTFKDFELAEYKGVTGQVFGLENDDRVLFLRIGVTEDGKRGILVKKEDLKKLDDNR